MIHNNIKQIFISVVILLIFGAYPYEAYGQDYQFKENDQKRIVEKLDNFIQDFTNSLCLCEKISEGTVDASANRFKEFPQYFSDSGKIIENIFFEEGILDQSWLSPAEYRSYASKIYRNINVEAKAERYSIFYDEVWYNSPDLRELFNKVYFDKKGKNDFKFTIIVHVNFLGQPYEGEIFLDNDTTNPINLKSNFISDQPLRLSINFGVNKRKTKGFLKSKTIEIDDLTVKVSGIEKVDTKTASDIRISQKIQSVDEQTELRPEDSKLIYEESKIFFEKFSKYLMLRDENTLEVNNENGQKLIDLFKYPERKSIYQGLFFENRTNLITPDEFVNEFTSIYRANESTYPLRKDNFIIQRIELNGKKAIKIYYDMVIAYRRFMITQNKDSIYSGENVNLKVVVESPYSFIEDDNSNIKLIVDRDNFRILVVSNSFDDTPVKMESKDFYDVGASISAGLPGLTILDNTNGFSNLSKEPGSMISFQAYGDYFPKPGKNKIDLGVGMGIGYNSSKMHILADSLNISYEDKNELGHFNHIIDGSNIKQKVDLSYLTIPIYCKLRHDFRQNSFITISFGLSFNFQLNTSFTGEGGTIKHSGAYDMEFPDGTIIPTLIEDVPEYNFTEYPSEIKEYSEDIYQSFWLSAILSSDFNTKISKQEPFYFTAGASFNAGLTDLFNGSENSQTIQGGSTDNFFSLASKHKMYAFGVQFGILYFIKNKTIKQQ